MLTRWGVGACYTSTTADARLHLPKHAASAWRSSDGPLIHAVAHPCLLTVIRRGVAAVLILRLPWQGSHDNAADFQTLVADARPGE